MPRFITASCILLLIVFIHDIVDCSSPLQRKLDAGFRSNDGAQSTQARSKNSQNATKKTENKESASVFSKKEYEELLAEVSKSDGDVKQSLPELKHARGNYFVVSKRTVNLENGKGQQFQVLVLSCSAMTWPGEDFLLAYLKKPKGKFVHWKSRWQSVRDGELVTRLFDVNDDGRKEFCIVRKPYERPEQVLAAYSIRDGKFILLLPSGLPISR